MFDKKAKENREKFIYVYKKSTRFLVELWRGFKNDSIPHFEIGIYMLAFGIIIYFHLDLQIFKLLKKEHLYPESYFCVNFIYWPVVTILLFFGYLGWAANKAHQHTAYLDRLTKIFSEAGLKTKLNRLPSYVADREIDPYYRALTLYKNGVSFPEFVAAKDKLSESMHCYVEEILDHREAGHIEIRYSEKDFDKIIDLDSPNNYPNYSFTIGNTRIGKQTRNLSDVPQLLVGGTSNSGKSTFLRQFITTLYINNLSMNFTLIDLKNGLESICFRDLPRLNCITEAKAAIAELEKIEALIATRAKILLANNCEKIEEFFKISVNERKYPEASLDKNLSRHLIVIDEAAELFLASSHLNSEYVMKARRIVQTLCAQGRAVGLHVIVSTQRPDKHIVDMSIKTNLQGRICFYMSDNASSMTILDNGRASDLPNIPGRAIWKNGSDLFEIQVPKLTNEQANGFLDNLRVKKKEVEIKKEAEATAAPDENADLEKDA